MQKTKVYYVLKRFMIGKYVYKEGDYLKKDIFEAVIRNSNKSIIDLLQQKIIEEREI